MAVLKLNTGAEIPQIGLGTWRSTSEEAYNAVKTAIAKGYKHIDTAAMYKNEAEVGRAIKDSGIPREELFVTTKLWGTSHRTPQTALDTSLAKLGLDYVDLYLMHWPVPLVAENESELLEIPTNPDGSRRIDNDWDFIKTWELMQKILATGKAKAIGVSNFSVNNLKTLLLANSTTVVPAANQVEIHPLLPQNDILEYCNKNGIVVEAYSPLGTVDSPYFKDETLSALATKNGVSVASLLINWALKRGYVVLPKSSNPKRIEDNLKEIDLSEEDFAKITGLIDQFGERRFVQPNWGSFPIFE